MWDLVGYNPVKMLKRRLLVVVHRPNKKLFTGHDEMIRNGINKMVTKDLFYGVSTLFESFNAELSHFKKSLYVSRSSYLQTFQLNVNTVRFQTVQFSVIT